LNNMILVWALQGCSEKTVTYIVKDNFFFIRRPAVERYGVIWNDA
jgi:hypothetical protein